MNPNHPTSAMVSANIKSSTPNAKSLRTRKLLDDKFSERITEQTRKSKRRARVKRLAKMAEGRAYAIRGAFLARIRHHLSRGRSAADIAVREGWMVSRVESAIAEVSK